MSCLLTSFLTVFFHLLYHQFSWTYNLVARIVSCGMWFQWVDVALPFLDQGPILEIGFGTGHLLGELSERGIYVTGLDQSLNMVKLSRSSLRKKQLFPGLVNGSTQYLPFPDIHFQRIVSTFPAPYILERQTWLEFWRILSPGGLVVILPTAWITGGSARYKFTAWLFRVTHQDPPAKDDLNGASAGIDAGLEAIGFEVKQRIVELPNSKVLCILAEKPLLLVNSSPGD